MVDNFNPREFLEFTKKANRGHFERVNTNLNEILEGILDKIDSYEFYRFMAAFCAHGSTADAAIRGTDEKGEKFLENTTATLLTMFLLFFKENKKIISVFLEAEDPKGDGV